MEEFSHLKDDGSVYMVDISDKPLSRRVAVASGAIYCKKETIDRIKKQDLPKGNIFTTAQIAGIEAAKKTAFLIPLCHQIGLSHVDLQFEIKNEHIAITATVSTTAGTGVEMEALTAVSIAGLTIYDMCKAIDKTMKIGDITLCHKSKQSV